MYKQMIVAVGIVLMLCSCDLDVIPDESPDLVIVSRTPEIRDYCIRSGENLEVTVKNQGSSPSNTSTTTVDFFLDRIPPEQPILLDAISKSTPVLNARESTKLLFKIPLGCFDPDCDFSIKVDVQDAVAETDEDNNIIISTCIG